jgi:RNA recognition motif-containing protein
MKNIYVGNLSFSVTNNQLNDLFSAFGQVSKASVVMDRETGRSKGFGFVEMGSDSEANAAITALNGKEVDGRTINVNEAKPREDSRPSFGGGRDRSGPNRRY